jgi:DNA-binding SARP family transcriptional activator
VLDAVARAGGDAGRAPVCVSAGDNESARASREMSAMTMQVPAWPATLKAGDLADAAVVVRPAMARGAATASLDVYCLGLFRAFVDDRLVTDWPNGKSKSVFKYLVTHRDRPISRDVLMDTFWPHAEPDAARNNLNVAIYGLRKLLARTQGAHSYVLYRDGCYLLNPDLDIWVDAEAFAVHCRKAEALAQRGEHDAAIAEHRAAEAIYQGEFLAEDRYEDWVIERRQSLREQYCTALDRLGENFLRQQDYEGCMRICRAMLLVDDCDEEAHRRLMRCYCRLGQTHLAIRQYHHCVESLERRMHLAPSLETVELQRSIRQRALA